MVRVLHLLGSKGKFIGLSLRGAEAASEAWRAVTRHPSEGLRLLRFSRNDTSMAQATAWPAFFQTRSEEEQLILHLDGRRIVLEQYGPDPFYVNHLNPI